MAKIPDTGYPMRDTELKIHCSCQLPVSLFEKKHIKITGGSYSKANMIIFAHL
jgi:hypothetical protein